MFKKKSKELTREQQDVLNAVYELIQDGIITFGVLEPVTNDPYYSKLIESYIKEQKEEIRQRHITIIKLDIRRAKRDLESAIQQRDKYNACLTEFRAELVEQKNKESLLRDETRIQNLLWWIFNNEESLENLEDDIRNKEAKLKEMEDNLLKAEEEK